MQLQTLNQNYRDLSHLDRLRKLFQDFDRVLVTSSFGTTAAILLDMLRRVRPDYPIHFIDTHYLFPETHAYREELTQRWNLNVVTVKPGFNAHLYTRMDYTWAHQPDACCYVNKVSPLEGLKTGHDLWLSGMIGGLSDSRRKRDIFEWDGHMYRFYPLVDMSAQEAEWYRIAQELPPHPLEAKGYGSVGCQQCTVKGQGRSGRWAGTGKTECGLHIFGNHQPGES